MMINDLIRLINYIDYELKKNNIVSLNYLLLSRLTFFSMDKSIFAEDLVKAKKIFEDMLREYPMGEEASIATLCIAEVYFRQRNNEAALELYREIVEKYPGTQAAQNAAEGIKYLESFAKHEASFVPPDVEDKKRRRR